ncbi:MAG: preprotein translocase subunit YajC [Paludibacteraceae bacterium]|nr:preprotein translocase subunit YajC [Paludibacteraceae bacterium]
MLNYILLQVAETGAEGQNQWSFWIMMIAIFVVMWLFMIRPQQKKQKELQKQREAMQRGDKVITAGGIHGEIKEVKDNYFVISIAKDVHIRVDKASVYAMEEPDSAKKDDKKEDK